MARFDMSVQADVKAAQRYLDRAQRQAVPKAASRALNRTIGQVDTQARREIARGLGMKQKRIRPSLRVIKANWSRLRAAVVATGNRIPLIRFGARQTRKGVTARVGGKRRLYPGAFIATMKSGHRGVFWRRQRRPRGDQRWTDIRLPIEQLFGPSVPGWFVRGEVESAMRRTATQRWPINFTRDLRYYLRRARG